MSINDLPALSALRTRMQWHQERQRVLAENVSNSNTPNFKPRDLVELKFNEKGGNVDFVAPEPDTDKQEEAPEGDVGPTSALAEVRKVIKEYQAQREQLKLLTDGSDAA